MVEGALTQSLSMLLGQATAPARGSLRRSALGGGQVSGLPHPLGSAGVAVSQAVLRHLAPHPSLTCFERSAP